MGRKSAVHAHRRHRPPTVTQLLCPHQWHCNRTMRLDSAATIAVVRYYRCRLCELTEKTVEQAVSPDPAAELVQVVQQWFADRIPCYLRDQGITELPLYGLNTLLARQGYVIHAAKVRDSKQFVACKDKDGRVEHYGLFTLQRIEEEAPAGTNTNGKRRRGR